MASKDPIPFKDAICEQQFRKLAATLKSINTDVDEHVFLSTALDGLDDLTLMQRVRRASEAIAQATKDYDSALLLLVEAAPRLSKGFMSFIAPDYVGQYGRHDFERSMAALKFFTPFGTSEFAVREFLRDDTPRALEIMKTWSLDCHAAVRRLASEGCRPRLPWSFRLAEIEASPELAAPILENLHNDSSLYVRRSVANHLNDITKTHPEWVLERVALWDSNNPQTRWIIRQALRTLIKQGNNKALAIMGADAAPEITAHEFSLSPAQLSLGESLTLFADLSSTSTSTQKLIVDYRLHYVRQNGTTSRKVFKLKELILAPGERIRFSRKQQIRDFTTRKHYPGKHQAELIMNGEVVASAFFELRC